MADQFLTRSIAALRKENTTLRQQLATHRARKNTKKVKYPSVVILPDSHAHPEYDNERYTLLGRYLRDNPPDLLVDIGDFADMPSLSSYDKGRRSFEGRRYRRDVDAAIDAQEKLAHAAGHAWSRIDKVRTLGNHDGERIARLTQERSELDGLVSVDDLRSKDYGWKVYPFMVPFIADAIAYQHYFATGVSGRPISGDGIGKTLLSKNYHSSVQGHSHVFDMAERTRADGQKMFGLSVGCFAHPDMIEGWNTATEKLWWRGIVRLDGIDGRGSYQELQSISLSALEARYG